MIASIRSRKKLGNSLVDGSESGRWSGSKTKFEELTSDEVLDFPEITEHD